jgi:hypothetical protein
MTVTILHDELGVVDFETVGADTFLTLDDVRIAIRDGQRWRPILPGYTIREISGGMLLIEYNGEEVRS